MRLLERLTIRFLPTSVLLIACGASHRAVTRQTPSLAAQVNQTAGCYSLIEGGRHLPEGFPATPVILLDSVSSDADESPMTLTAQVLATDSVARPAATAVWTMDAGHSNLIRVWLINGTEGSGLTLRGSGDTLAGDIRRFANFPKVSLTHRARAIRVRCPK